MDDQFYISDNTVDVDMASVVGLRKSIVLPSSEPSYGDFHFSNSNNFPEGFRSDDGDVFTSLEQTLGPFNFVPLSSEVALSDDDGSYPVLNYINQILMEEHIEAQPGMNHDPLALQAAENSFYQILSNNYPPPASESVAVLENSQTSDCSIVSSSNHHSTESNDIDGAPEDPLSVLDALKFGQNYQHLDNHFMSSFQASSFASLQPLQSSSITGDRQVSSFTDAAPVSSFFSETEAMLLFKKGLEEGYKFLPTGSQCSIDLDDHKLSSSLKVENLELVANGKGNKKENTIHNLRERKHQLQDDGELDLGRSNKQSAVHGEENELAEIFDALMLYADKRIQCSKAASGESSESSKILHQDETLNISDFVKSYAEKKGTDGDSLDINATLIRCAESVATGDQRSANELLNQIRQHASCFGTSQQRLAVIFANALEARLNGTGTDLYVALTSRRISAAEDLKAYRILLCAPFRQMISFFANDMILQVASKAAALHIVDFGISYGFLWPNFIQLLSQRAGGPPKLRITGIDLPQPGFRPAQRIEQTGRRLAKYCEKFNIPFQFQAIASRSWEKIEIEELKLRKNEVLAINTHYHLKNLLDESVVEDCPRDAVLRLIRNMNPDIVVSAVLNAPIVAPFFLTRFREALHYYSSLFDAIDNNLPRKDLQRMRFEQEFFGPEVMNVIACEGKARVERPETYKHWQIRFDRAGFRILPLNQDLLKELKQKVKEGYHKDFMLDGDGYWMHMGWKGKTITCSSCWTPAERFRVVSRTICEK